MAKFCAFAVLAVLYVSSKAEASIDFDGELTFLNDYDLEEIKMPNACVGNTFCLEKGDNYPDEKIAELVSDVKMMLNIERPSIGDRKKRALSGFHEETEPLCASNTTYSPMYYIIDENDRVRVVVQAPNKFEQFYSLKWCLNEGPITRKSSFLPEMLIRRFSVECVTCKIDLELFVLSDEVDSETKKPKMEIAKVKGGVPACCKCQYNSKY